jgi:Domain of unknown function (DUF4375)
VRREAGFGREAVFLKTGDGATRPRVRIPPPPLRNPSEWRRCDPTLQIIPDDNAQARQIVRRAGTRADFRVPASAIARLAPGPLVRAVVLRPFYELSEDGSGLRRLDKGQRAIYAMYVADGEILDGGFAQFWLNPSGALGNDLVAAARLVGSPEFADIFRDAAALWPNDRIPRARAKREALLDTLDQAKIARLDERYAATQYKRRTALANVLAPYIRAHTDQFVAG